MKKISVGIIGYGHWGPNYVRNFSRFNNCVVKYACDLHLARLRNIKSTYPNITATDDYRIILKDNSVDAVVVSTAASSHYRLVKAALMHNKHVLVEKPFVLDVTQGKRLVQLANKRHRILMVAHTFLYNNAIRKLKDLIAAKSLGRVYYLHSKRTNLGPVRKDVSALWDLAPHDISIFSFLLGLEPYEVVARGSDYLQDGKEDVAFITLSYPHNIIAHIHVSWLDPRKVREVTIVGSKKMVVFDDLNTSEPLRLFDKRVVKRKYKLDYSSFKEFQMLIKEKGVIVLKVKTGEPLKLECRHFLDCIQYNLIPLTDGRNGLNVLRILIAIQKSITKGGKAVRLSSV